MIGQKAVPSRMGGIEVHVEEIAKRLVQMGHEVDLYLRAFSCNERNAEYEGIGLKYICSINTKNLDAISYSILATISALGKNYDIYHFHALGPSTMAFLPRIFNKKVICTVHGLDWKRDKWGKFASVYLKFGEYACAKFSNRSITVTPMLVDYFLGKYSKRFDYIANGVYIRPRIGPELIRSFGLDKKSYILSLARIVPEKGLHYLIEAYKMLKTDKKLVIAGDLNTLKAYSDKCIRLSEDDPNILFMGQVKGKLLCELFSNAFLYILPSTIEGMPISLLEAMSYGICCLTSDIPENHMVIRDYGYTFKSEDVNDLISKLNEILVLNIKDYETDMSKNMIEYIQKNYNWDVSAKLTLDIYRLALEN